MTRLQIPDLQAVVLCGPGHRLAPMIDEEKLPKCLLPIANRPMLYYPLTWLMQAGITDVIVVAHAVGGSRVQNYLTRIFDGGRVDLVLLEEYEGPMQALLNIKSRLKHDFLVVSCDLITDFPLSRLIEKARTSEALAIALLATPVATCWGQQPKESTEPRHRLSEEGGIIVGLDSGASPSTRNLRVLHWMHRDDLDEEGSLSLPMALLTRYPHLRLRTDLVDAHCYLLRRCLLDDVVEGEAGAGHETGTPDGSGAHPAVLASSSPIYLGLMQHSFSLPEDYLPRLVRRQLGSADHYRCEVMLVEGETHYCVRTNTLSAYAEANKQMARILGSLGVRLTSQAAEIGSKTQVGADSMIGDQSKVGDKSSVKRSVVGNYVQIGNNVKISNSLIMDYAVVEAGVKLEGCIVGFKALVRERSQLKDCDVAFEYTVEREGRTVVLIMGGVTAVANLESGPPPPACRGGGQWGVATVRGEMMGTAGSF